MEAVFRGIWKVVRVVWEFLVELNDETDGILLFLGGLAIGAFFCIKGIVSCNNKKEDFMERKSNVRVMDILPLNATDSIGRFDIDTIYFNSPAAKKRSFLMTGKIDPKTQNKIKVEVKDISRVTFTEGPVHELRIADREYAKQLWYGATLKDGIDSINVYGYHLEIKMPKKDIKNYILLWKTGEVKPIN